MLRKLIIVAVLVLVTGAAAVYVLTEPARVPTAILAAHTPNLDNGRTMFFAGGCASCHASSKEDRTRLGGGMALHSPFGTFYAPNISPDPADGIGRWSEADFVSAMQDGTSPDGRHYYPAFPYTSYQRMEPSDLRDLFAFLKTLPAVAGKVQDHDMAFPFSVRRGIGLWKLVYLDGTPFRPDPSRSAAWNRGAYLVNGPGHCAECHSPRDSFGGIRAGQRFAGGPNPEGEGWVPNITGKGLAKWSAKDVAYMLETGELPDGDSVGGGMAAVVRNTAQLSAEDRAAMAEYLKSLPPVDGPPRPARR
ncbi:MAG: c-type cytochrome [Rhodoplanes sp.]|uniref:c-type cytochrome n=1 Tax=Rhodoplanes sp. TaxID=1968906 RepID=UPI00184B16D9|nr:cytochrome c [Rhodoplanes sp.]NVO15651.1 c-type cytochrome [Rhodoplanes sp.]